MDDETAQHLPRYRAITGVDDAAFCRRVSAALEQGYVLHGSPAITSHDGRAYLVQAVVWDGDGPTPRA